MARLCCPNGVSRGNVGLGSISRKIPGNGKFPGEFPKGYKTYPPKKGPGLRGGSWGKPAFLCAGIFSPFLTIICSRLKKL